MFTAHRDETFQAETEEHKLTLRLEKRRGRLQGSEVKVCYQFVLVAKEDLPLDAEG